MNIAIVGATGLVGRKIIKILNEKQLDKGNNIFLYASKNSNGKVICVNGKSFMVKELSASNLEKHYDFAFFSAGKTVSLAWAKVFNKKGAIVIDNSSAFRRCKNIPLVVPEVNAYSINNQKIIANPNCSTIGASIPISVLNKLYKVKRVIVSTYQAVSGAGQKGINDLKNGTDEKFSNIITNNLIPQIDYPLKNGYTYEENKMEFELKKILKNQNLKVSATCVRVPIENCHSESINIEFEEVPNLSLIKKELGRAKGIKIVDNLESNIYPMPILANENDDVFVGRVRRDTSNKKAINFFVCFDNIRKGAALNAVQIMEYLISLKQN